MSSFEKPSSLATKLASMNTLILPFLATSYESFLKFTSENEVWRNLEIPNRHTDTEMSIIKTALDPSKQPCYESQNANNVLAIVFIIVPASIFGVFSPFAEQMEQNSWYLMVH